MQLSPTRLFTCTACGAVLPVGEELVGKPCRCGRCGKVSIVGEETPRRRKEKAAEEEPLFGFSCRVCETRLAARPRHVGRKAKCPDCGAITEVPPPPKPQPKQKPRAMHGQQYGLWGVDEAPLPSELAAGQPKFHPVWCRVCDTLMHAKANQIGKKLSCPDCGAKTVVPEPPEQKPSPSVLVPDGEEYQLDAATVPPPRPEPQFSPPKPGEARTKKQLPPIRQERGDRPKPPPLPILVGVLRMLMHAPVTTWFFWFAGISITIGGFMMMIVMLNPIASIPFFIGAGLTLLLGLGALASLCLAVLTESSEGADRLYHPPGPVFVDWAGDAFYLFSSMTLAAAPWWILCRTLDQQLTPVLQAGILLVGWLFTFPLLLLSCLENGSAWEPYSPSVFASVARRPGHWLLLVIVSLAIVAGVGYAGTALMSAALDKSVFLALLETPLVVAASLVYFRVLGRFAWWLAESLPIDEDSQN